MNQAETQHAINVAVGLLDRWFDTMRGTHGYTGPIAHWWQQRLTWNGTALDWRYEGIIGSYLELWRTTGHGQWLAKAQWAGDDLLAGQNPNGHFGRGSADADLPGPGSGMCAAALLELALALRQVGGDVWQPYAAAGELAIHGALIGELWDNERNVFLEATGAAAFYPHRNAAICEALFRQAELRQLPSLVEDYALPALRTLIATQVRGNGTTLDGALPYRATGTRTSAKYLPLTTARCVPGLMQAYEWTSDQLYFEAAWRAYAFVQRCRNADGSFPAIMYAGGRCLQYPHWIAGVGDVARAAAALRTHGVSTNCEPTMQWLLRGQDASGGIATARGFGAPVRQRLGPIPDVRDQLHVTGWCDKAFRALALEATDIVAPQHSVSTEHRCVYRGRPVTLYEDDTQIEITRGRETRYRWRKGDDYPTICAPEFILE